MLKVSKQLIEVRRFSIELSQTGTHLAHVSNKPGVISQNVANRIQGIPGRRVKLCLLDQVGGYFEGRSHNADYG
ncbi:hypothetical protein [Pseudomonas leptonychotis]|uniref:hypothetical protein n=1 Tax=Pseudomonas leptonychotis TaxID=2448482 RepID=UPI003867B1EE